MLSEKSVWPGGETAWPISMKLGKKDRRGYWSSALEKLSPEALTGRCDHGLRNPENSQRVGEISLCVSNHFVSITEWSYKLTYFTYLLNRYTAPYPISPSLQSGLVTYERKVTKSMIWLNSLSYCLAAERSGSRLRWTEKCGIISPE